MLPPLSLSAQLTLSTGDKNTTEIVQILHGDDSVVNVVQGHPKEPMMAVSGIDHTIKIFSPDRQLQEQARLGIGINNGEKLGSRQRMARKEQLVRDNRAARESGLSDTVITVSLRRMLRNQVALSYAEWIALLAGEVGV